MKKVIVKRFIEAVWVNQEGGSRKKVEGTGVWSDFVNEALFHGWGLDSDDGASYTVAIVQYPGGTCDLIPVSNIKFIY